MSRNICMIAQQQFQPIPPSMPLQHQGSGQQQRFGASTASAFASTSQAQTVMGAGGLGGHPGMPGGLPQMNQTQISAGGGGMAPPPPMPSQLQQQQMNSRLDSNQVQEIRDENKARNGLLHAGLPTHPVPPSSHIGTDIAQQQAQTQFNASQQQLLHGGLPPMPQTSFAQHVPTASASMAHPGFPSVSQAQPLGPPLHSMPMPQMGGGQQMSTMSAGGVPMGPGMAPMPPQAHQQQHHPQRRLDPNLMPSAIQVIQDDSKARSGLFQTGFPTAEPPPLVTTDFYSEDQGNCSPLFMRATMYCAPANSDLLKTSAIPFGLCISPFSGQDPKREYPPPIVNLGDLGPVRCHRCKAYMCPFMEFQDGGRRFRCPFCKCSTEVPQEYFAHLDHQGRRTDLYERPELYLGSVEYLATKEYCKNGIFPNAPAFIFMLDVSYNSVHNGIVELFCQNIKAMLEDLPREIGVDESELRVGFATYDQSVHFYNLKSSLDQPQMMIVGDIQDMFVPMVEGFLVNPKEAEAAIDCLLQEIPNMFSETRITEIILGPVIQAGMDALKAADRAGKLFVFHSSLPILEAPGKLKNRDDRKLLGTDKEKTVLSPHDDFYTKLAQECVGVGCCVDLFLFPNSFIDVATLGNLCGITGGQIYKYQYFQIENDGARFLEDLHHNIERPIVFDAMMRVRTSTGIRPTDFFGSFFMSNTTDVELAALDSDKAVTIEIKHDDKLEDSVAYIQTAVLFTSVSGQRRLRIHSLALPVAENHQNLYRFADLDTVVNFITKHAGKLLLQKNPKDVKEYLVNRTAQILATYRERCSEQAPPGQLILPECMKLLPLYTSCILKNDAFFGASDLTTDDKAWLLQTVPSLRVRDSVNFFYPRLMAVRELPPEAADSDNYDMPIAVRCGYENLASDGVYFLENGSLIFLWIGLNCPSQWVQDVFGCNAVTQINVDKHELPERDTLCSRALRRFMRRIQRERPRTMKAKTCLLRRRVCRLGCTATGILDFDFRFKPPRHPKLID